MKTGVNTRHAVTATAIADDNDLVTGLAKFALENMSALEWTPPDNLASIDNVQIKIADVEAAVEYEVNVGVFDDLPLLDALGSVLCSAYDFAVRREMDEIEARGKKAWLKNRAPRAADVFVHWNQATEIVHCTSRREAARYVALWEAYNLPAGSGCSGFCRIGIADCV